MIRQSSVTILLATVASLVACAAGSSERPDNGISRARSEHGISLGDHLAGPRLTCDVGGPRSVGEPGTLQVVTFATPQDCVACDAHLTGVQKALSNTKMRSHAFIVVWSPELDEVRRAFSRNPDVAKNAVDNPLPVCVDAAGHFWDHYMITSTPFTVVLASGRVVYITDQPVALTRQRQEFLADLDAVAVAP